MARSFLKKNLTSRISLSSVIFYLIACVQARLQDPRIYHQEIKPIPGKSIIDEKYIVVFKERSGITSAELSSSWTDRLIGKYDALMDKSYSNLYSGFSGLGISNMTEEEVSYMTKEPGVFLIEKDVLLNVDRPESKDEDKDKDKDRRVATGGQGKYDSVKAFSNDQLSEPLSVDVACIEQTIPWGVQRVGGPVDMEGSSKRVFIIDTGVADLNAFNIDRNLAKSFLPDDDSWIDGNGHGTHIAGIIAARDDGCDVVGVAAGVTIVPVRVLNISGSGYLSSVVAGIRYATEMGQPGDVANLSLGGQISSDILDNALIAAAQKGVIFSVSAGNANIHADLFSPARTNFDGIYTVSAVNQDDCMAWFSNYGSPPVDFAAPGVQIKSLWKDGSIYEDAGTSMAAAHVAGLLVSGSLRGNGTAYCDPEGLNKHQIAHR